MEVAKRLTFDDLSATLAQRLKNDGSSSMQTALLDVTE